MEDKLPTFEGTWQILAEAIARWGEDTQLDMVIEECAELIKAIQKYRRDAFKTGITLAHSEEVEPLIDEIADVYVMLMQMMLMVGANNVGKRVTFKLARLRESLHHGG